MLISPNQDGGGLKYYVDAVESLLQHGLEPVLVLDFNVLGPQL